MFYSVGVFRTSGLGDSISSNPARTALRRGGEEPGYIEALQQWAGSLNIKRLLLIKENQLSQVKEFSTFPLYEKRQVPGLSENIPFLNLSSPGAFLLAFSCILHFFTS